MLSIVSKPDKGPPSNSLDSPSTSKCGTHHRQSRARARGLSYIDPKFIAEVGHKFSLLFAIVYMRKKYVSESTNLYNLS